MISKQNQQKIWLGGMLLFILLLSLGSNALPAEAQTSHEITTYAAYQEFENGFMVWREDSREIIAFVHSTQTLHRFPESNYEHLNENPVPESPPNGRFKPVRGFGRVWGNFEYVRALLGWGLGEEFGYTAVFHSGVSYPGYGWNNLTLPSGSVVELYDNTWAYWGQTPPVWNTPTPPAPLPYTTNGSIQVFENGRMLYAANSGTIWVLLNSGQAYTFHTNEYGQLPDNPVWGTAPYGYMKPILGFGKVWGNFATIRHSLGWALAYENSYMMQLIGSPTNISIQLPDGAWVNVTTVGSWNYQ